VVVKQLLLQLKFFKLIHFKNLILNIRLLIPSE